MCCISWKVRKKFCKFSVHVDFQDTKARLMANMTIWEITEKQHSKYRQTFISLLKKMTDTVTETFATHQLLFDRKQVHVK